MTAWAPSSWRWEHHAELGSTQDRAVEAARAGAAGQLAVLADQQSAGRGRSGRSWLSPSGNLNLSLLLRPGARPDAGYWAMLAGVALYEALAPWAAGLVLKWPNDVLCRGGKLGGILIDSAVRADGVLDWVVIGMGANLMSAPRLAGRATACLGTAGPPPRVVAEDVVSALNAWASQDVRAAWLARAHPPGTPLQVQTRHGQVTAPFAGLTERGELLLSGVSRPINTGDVFLAWPMTTVQAPCC